MQVPGGSGTQIGPVLALGPKATGGGHLVGAEGGLFVYRNGQLKLMRGKTGSETGSVSSFGPELAGGAHLVRAEGGLFVYRDGRLEPVPGGAESETGWVEPFGPEVAGGGQLVGTDNGLFVYRDGRLEPVPDGSESEIGLVGAFGAEATGGGHLVGARRGLFVYRDGRLEPVPGGAESEFRWVSAIGLELAGGGQLVGTDNGLFVYRDGRLDPVPGGAESETGWVESLGPEVAGGGRLVGTYNGLFVYRDGRLEPVPGGSVHEAGEVRAFAAEAVGDNQLVDTEVGLFVYRDGRLEPLPGGTRSETGWVESLGPEVAGGGRLVGTDNGLFVYRDGRLDPVPGGSESGIGWVESFGPEVASGGRLVGGDEGLFVFQGPKPPIVIQAKTATEGLRGELHRFAWILNHDCDTVWDQAFWDHAAWFQVKLVGDKVYPALVIDSPTYPPDGFEVWSEILLEATDGTTVEAQLETRLLADEAPPLPRDPVAVARVKVNWGPEDYALDFVKRFGGWVVLAHTLIFLGLVVAARSSGWAWRVLGDKIWGRAGLWFWVLFRHVPVVQRWVLQRWFVAMRERLPEPRVLPLPLAGPDAVDAMSDRLVEMLAPGRRLWLQGAAGMGKTLLVDEVAVRYFRDPPSLAASRSRYGYVLIPITLRSFASVPVPEQAPEDWLFDLVARRLEGTGLALEDQQLLKGILVSGSFVLVLDGANEVDDKSAIALFAARFPDIGLLVTSQADPEREAVEHFEVWRLPTDVGGAVEPLLDLYLGEAQGRAALASIDRTAIRSELCSGYDVRLLADLLEGGLPSSELPDSRLGLYRALLDAVEKRVPDYPVPDLCRAAWRAWCEGRRDLKPGDNIEASLLQPLMDTDARIVRALDGTSYAFRHDQMRGYLAARWGAVFEVSPRDLFEQTNGLWRIARIEQRVMWEFFADLIEPTPGLALLRWARQEPERAELQVALNRVAERDGWEEAAALPTLVEGGE
ncbi:hypothetical protein ABWI00_06000 [Algihabitans albus]|uniref:NACHT domain-containing protein n=1 Tax=Algihabitans albus TaxID=2164067 RepID=UPI0035CF2315